MESSKNTTKGTGIASTKPYWQQHRDMKLTGKPAAEKKVDQKKDLGEWFDRQIQQCPAKCENCGKLIHSTILHPRENVCHIVPKDPTAGCPSVATAENNRWFGCLDCHTFYDKGSVLEVAKMTVITVCRQRFQTFKADIPQSEMRRVQPFLTEISTNGGKETKRPERALQAKEKIKALISWFDKRELPKGPIKINSFSTIEDCNKFVATQIARLSSMEIFSKVLQTSYIHLLQFKKILENEQAGATDNK